MFNYKSEGDSLREPLIVSQESEIGEQGRFIKVVSVNSIHIVFQN